LTVEAWRLPADDSWWVRISGLNRWVRRVRSLDEVRGLVGEFECSHVDWRGVSYAEMVAPADPPAWLK
jgi:hypothetical protein